MVDGIKNSRDGISGVYKKETASVKENEVGRESQTQDEFTSDTTFHLGLLSPIQRGTPQFIKDMINYCLSEIGESVEDNSVDDYVECVEQIVSHLLSPNYPCELVSHVDLAATLQTLNASYTKMLKRCDESQTQLLETTIDRIGCLRKRFELMTGNCPIELPKIEDRNSDWLREEKWGKKNVESLKSRPLASECLQYVPGVENYEIWPVSNDGACWARSLWQATLAKLEGDDKLDDFLRKVRETIKDFAHDQKFFANNDISDVLAITRILSKMTRSQRQKALCFERIDLTLQMFTRKLVASVFRRENEEKTGESLEYIERIELPSTFGGAHEINCFAKYFGLQIQEITAVMGEKKMRLKFHTYNADEPSRLNPLDEVIMYGSSPVHYEVLIRK